MPAHDRLQLVREAYGAYESGDRRAIEELLSDDLTFYSPADVGIDRGDRGPHVRRRQDPQGGGLLRLGRRVIAALRLPRACRRPRSGMST